MIHNDAIGEKVYHFVTDKASANDRASKTLRTICKIIVGAATLTSSIS